MCENLTTEEAAQYLGLSLATLKKWRQRKQGPSYLKLGSRVYYEIQELDRFLVNCKVIPQTFPKFKEYIHGYSHNSNS